jgi:hypothetical protein
MPELVIQYTITMITDRYVESDTNVSLADGSWTYIKEKIADCTSRH